MKNTSHGLIAILVGLAITSSATAADVVSEPQQDPLPPPASEWTFAVAPYFWGAGLDGNVGLFGHEPVDVDLSFSDIFDGLRFGGMMVGEAHNGTWGVLGDLIYVSTVSNQSITRSVDGVPATLSARVATQSFAGTVMGEYRALANERATLDLMAGARIWSVDNDISVTLSAGGPELASLSGSDGATWVDPMLGAKLRLDTGSPWYFTAWGMIGGFGAGSDIAWDLLGGVGYQWNEHLATVGGYRALGVDYAEDGFVYDVVQHGPFIGVAYRF